MELASRIRWILVIAVISIALLLIIWGLFSIASNIFRGNDGPSVATVVNGFRIEDVSTATFRAVGPVVSVEDHRSYTIAVSQNVVVIRVFAGYDERLIAERSYRNTPTAYRTFLSALTNAEVIEQRRGTLEEFGFEDEGVCARGSKYFLELDTDLFRWSTSCPDREGNAGFRMSPVRGLFQAQIPDFSEITRDARL
jgi:hypothetical protein